MASLANINNKPDAVINGLLSRGQQSYWQPTKQEKGHESPEYTISKIALNVYLNLN